MRLKKKIQKYVKIQNVQLLNQSNRELIPINLGIFLFHTILKLYITLQLRKNLL